MVRLGTWRSSTLQRSSQQCRPYRGYYIPTRKMDPMTHAYNLKENNANSTNQRQSNNSGIKYSTQTKTRGSIMAQLQMFVGDKVYNAILESMPGTTDDERLVELKKYIRGVIRDRVRFLRQEKVRAVVAAAIEAELAALDVELAE